MRVHHSYERGRGDYGWLKTSYSFSFASYFNPDRTGLGALRVLNEDWIEPGQGFPTHAHDNMEIVTIVLQGALEHKDSMGNRGVIRVNEVQRMSAGTGVQHSEYNHSKTEKCHLLQIWVFPMEQGIKPSYEQKAFLPEAKRNRLLPVVSSSDKGALRIHQDARFLLGNLDAGVSLRHAIGVGKAAYVFLINGEARIGKEILKVGDAAGITETDNIDIETLDKSSVLLIEVPPKGPS